jgi:hypothetical protein
MALWTPAELSSSILKAWYDFSDTATITESAGAVSQVNDKSGNANHITQATAGAKPTTGTQTLNSLNVLVFDGGDDLNKTTGTSLPSANPGAMLFVLRLYTSGTSGGLTWITQNGASTGDNCSLGRDVGNTGAWGNGTNNSTTTAATYADSDNTNWHLSGGVYTTASRIIYQDGTSQNTNANAITVSTPERIYVGLNLARDRSAGRNLTGRIAQVLVINGTDTATRERIEGWALWKYGLEANLPGGHPYVSAAPTVPPVTMPAAVGAFTLTGQSVNLGTPLIVPAAVGAFAFTGQSVNLITVSASAAGGAAAMMGI